MSIIGVGIDVAEIDRFAASLKRTPGLAERLFVESELLLPSGERRGVASLAARFAAKEAVAKALGAPAGLHWTDAEVYVEDSGQPRLRVTGTVAARAAELGVRSWHVSLSHDAGWPRLWWWRRGSAGVAVGLGGRGRVRTGDSTVCVLRTAWRPSGPLSGS